MEIKTKKEGTRIFVDAHIISKELGNRLMGVRFLLDTGADITSLSSDVTAHYKIDFSKLSVRTTMGVGGLVEVYRAKDVQIKFRDVEGNLVQFNLDQIDIRKPDSHMKNYAGKDMIPSLLGTDALRYLKFIYNSYPKLETKH